MIGWRTIGMITFLGLTACTGNDAVKSATPPGAIARDRQSTSGALTQQIADAMKLVSDQNWPQAAIALQNLVNARGFGALPADVQYRVLRTAEQVSVEHGSVEGHYDYFVRTTSLPQATSADWQDRLAAASRLGDKLEVAHCLTVLVRRWPDQALRFKAGKIMRTIRDAKSASRDSQFQLLQALYDAHWKFIGGIEPSNAWREFALLLLERGQRIRANDVAGHVSAAYDLIAMRADRRFDAIVGANPAHFDIEAAADLELQTWQAASEGAPDSLQLKARVIAALISRQRYEAALAASDAVVLDVKSTNFPNTLYKDYEDWASFVLEIRSIALKRVGRWDEALAQLEAASQVHDNLWGNAEQLVNLSELYDDLDRPKDALATIGRIARRTGPFGAMEVEEASLVTAFQLEDSSQVDRSLQYLRAHRSDLPLSYESGLLAANQQDRAAAEFIADLNNEDTRQDALLRAQDYAVFPGPPGEKKREAQWRKLIARRDVQSAVGRVGRVESYRLEPNEFGN